MTADQITAIAAVIGAAAVLVTAVGTLIVALRTEKAVDTVHKAVNGHATAQDDRIAQLTASLTKAGVIVPEKPE